MSILILIPRIEILFFQLKSVIESELLNNNLLPNAHTITKIIQLYETKNSRHSTMIVGRTQSGKTVTWKTLQASMNKLSQTDSTCEAVKVKEISF